MRTPPRASALCRLQRAEVDDPALTACGMTGAETRPHRRRPVRRPTDDVTRRDGCPAPRTSGHRHVRPAPPGPVQQSATDSQDQQDRRSRPAGFSSGAVCRRVASGRPPAPRLTWIGAAAGPGALRAACYVVCGQRRNAEQLAAGGDCVPVEPPPRTRLVAARGPAPASRCGVVVQCLQVCSEGTIRP